MGSLRSQFIDRGDVDKTLEWCSWTSSSFSW